MRLGWAATWVVVLSIAATMPALSTPPARTSVPHLGPMAGGCSGGSIPSQFNGTVAVEGALPAPPSTSNVSVAISYYYSRDFVPADGTSTTSCQNGAATNATDTSGTFHLWAGVPSSTCSRTSCTYYSGPFGPVSFSLARGPPPGYFAKESRSGTQVTLDLVAALSSVTIAPWGRITVSVNAPTVVHATAAAGDGSPSPSMISYAWRPSGNDWSVTSGAGTPNATVVGTNASSVGDLELWTNGTYGGGTTALPVTNLELIPVATSVRSVDVAPTSLDAGTPATFTVRGTGSAGYAYNATILPGLGSSAVTTPCASSVTLGGTVALTCVVLVTYGSAGTAWPTANLTNGWSTASTSFPSVTVAPTLGISLSPDPSESYSGATVEFTLGVDSSSGTRPYGPACLWGSNGSVDCRTTAGPTWTFATTFGAAGVYTIRGSVSDAAGANRTTSVVAQVFDAPSLSSITPSTNRLDTGSSVSASALYSGGALESEYWWNDSLPNGTLASGFIGRDGLLSAALVPSTVGRHTITLTVRDALGTEVAQSFVLEVAPGVVAALADCGGPGNSSVPAGTVWRGSWCAVDAAGDRLPDYSEYASITLSSSIAQTAWVNITGSSEVVAPGSGVPITPMASRSGYLNVSVTELRAGSISLRLAVPGTGNLSFTADALWSVVPNVDRVVLSHPDTVRAGVRTNSTLWRISDGFENPIPSGYIVVRTSFGGSTTNTDSPIRLSGAVAEVWVNYTAPADAPGTVLVLSELDQPLLPPIDVPAGGAAGVPSWAIALSGISAAALLVAYLVGRSMRRERPAATEGEASEDELRRVAEGRAHVLRRAQRSPTPLSMDELGAGFEGRIPSRPELAEWIAGLVSEGALRALPSPSGETRFAVQPTAPEPDAVPSVEVDADALEAALHRQSAIFDDTENHEGSVGR